MWKRCNTSGHHFCIAYRRGLGSVRREPTLYRFAWGASQGPLSPAPDALHGISPSRLPPSFAVLIEDLNPVAAPYHVYRISLSATLSKGTPRYGPTALQRCAQCTMRPLCKMLPLFRAPPVLLIENWKSTRCSTPRASHHVHQRCNSATLFCCASSPCQANRNATVEF